MRNAVLLVFFFCINLLVNGQDWGAVRTLKVMQSIYSGYYNNAGYALADTLNGSTLMKLHFFISEPFFSRDSLVSEPQRKAYQLFQLCKEMYRGKDSVYHIFANVVTVDATGRICNTLDVQGAFSDSTPHSPIAAAMNKVRGLPFLVSCTGIYVNSNAQKNVQLTAIEGFSPAILDKDYFVLIAAYFKYHVYRGNMVAIDLTYQDKKKRRHLFFQQDFDYQPYLNRLTAE